MWLFLLRRSGLIPNSHDLDKSLDELRGGRTGAKHPDDWTYFREWLERHGAEAPEDLPTAPEIPREGRGRV